MDVKKLEVVVTQQGIKPTADNLDKLVKAASSADPVLRTLTSTLNHLKESKLDGTSSNMGSIAVNIKAITASMEGVSKAAAGFSGVSTSFTAIANSAERLVSNVMGLNNVAAALQKIKSELQEMKGLSSVIPKVDSGGIANTRVGGGGSRKTTLDADTVATDKLTAAGKRLLAQAEREAFMINHTRAEWLEYSAAKKGVSEQAAPFIAKMKATEGQMGKVTMSAKQTAWALKMVPAQFTDIATQVAGGQSPFLIMLQQGGQLRDMFHGFGPMFANVGPMILRFVTNPLVLAGAAVGALTYAFIKGSQEFSNFSKAVVSSGGYIGQTATSLSLLADSLAAVGVKRSTAVEALVEVAKTGKVSSDNFITVSKAAAQMAAATGESISTLVAEFATLAEKPAEHIAKLNEKYHFLTAEIYAQISALEQQGKTQEAVALAMDTLAQASERMKQKQAEDIGAIESFWNNLKKVISEVANSMANIGKGSDQARLEVVQATIKQMEQQGALVKWISGRSIEAWKQEEYGLLEKIRLERTSARLQAESLAENDKLVNFQSSVNKTLGITISRKEHELALDKQIAAYKASGLQDKPGGLSDEKLQQWKLNELKKGEKGLTKASDKERKKEFTQDKELASIRATTEALQAQAEAYETMGLAAEKVSQHTIKAASYRKAAESEHATAQEKAALIEKANAEDLAAIQDKRLVKAKEVAQIEADARKNIGEQTLAVAKLNEQYENEASWISLSTKEKAKAKALWDIEIERKTKLLDIELRLSKAAGNERAVAALNEEKAATETLYNTKASLVERNMNLEHQELSLTENARIAFINYKDSMGEANDIMQNTFTSTYSSMTSAVTSFVTTGKMSFKSFAASMATMVAEMLVKLAMLKVAMMAVNMFGGSGDVPANADTTIPMQPGGGYAKGGVFGTDVAKFATGGMFTNSIVNRPTPFMFASGGVPSLGVMGEKPGSPGEAIVPLARMSNGNLGVETSGSRGSGSVMVNVEVNVASDGSATTSTSSNATDAKKLGEMIGNKVKEVIIQEQRPGGLLTR